jgi:ATP-binding cassette, subfamily B, bacterial
MRVRLYGHIQDLNYEFHNKSDSGDLIQRVTSDVETTTGFLTGRMLDAVHLLATLFFGAYQLIQINATMVWITFAIMPIIATSSIIYFVKIDKIFMNIEKTESNMMTVVQENLSGSRVVRAFANEAFEIEKMEKKNSEYRNALTKANKIIAIYWAVMDFIGISQYLIIIAVGVRFVQLGTMDAAGVAASLALVGMLIWPIRGLGRIINDFGKALVASDRINEILDKPSEYLNNGTLTPEIKGDIEFRDVSFKFSDTQEHLLKKVNFNIKAGQTVAIIGRTGSGKSTIINLLLRMYDYADGDILIDGIPLKDIEKKHIRNRIGVVLQDPFLYSKTVYENIAIAHKNADKDRVYRAAVTAALEKDIKTFKQGYETIVGEKGTTLSGGQKQRVAIARVLYRR